MSVPAVPLLVLFLASCAERIPPAPLVLFPPESVFTPCEQPKLQGDTWGDIGSLALALQTALSICAGQIGGLNAWRDSIRRNTDDI
ncbi:Rz1-like lysis system protein LysC [Serratia nevei]|uniref:Rz1-like lysis system protein LysC n=1 Tax=Serratia nevei TaxID=2703794 RepID=UPI003BEED9A3